MTSSEDITGWFNFTEYDVTNRSEAKGQGLRKEDFLEYKVTQVLWMYVAPVIFVVGKSAI